MLWLNSFLSLMVQRLFVITRMILTVKQSMILLIN
nr:MAG TPA: hypothetical protein [Caudoviricetes sp.]